MPRYSIDTPWGKRTWDSEDEWTLDMAHQAMRENPKAWQLPEDAFAPSAAQTGESFMAGATDYATTAIDKLKEAVGLAPPAAPGAPPAPEQTPDKPRPKYTEDQKGQAYVNWVDNFTGKVGQFLGVTPPPVPGEEPPPQTPEDRAAAAEYLAGQVPDFSSAPTVVRNAVSGTEQMVENLASIAARQVDAAIGADPKSGLAAMMLDVANSREQQQAELDKQSYGPTGQFLSRNMRGAVNNLAQAIPAGRALGPYGALAPGMAVQGNQAYQDAVDANNPHALPLAVADAVWEGIPGALMNKIGLPGLESIFGQGAAAAAKQGVAKAFVEGVEGAAKFLANQGVKLAGRAAAEIPEELVTEWGHNLETILMKAGAANPERVADPDFWQTTADTAMQTLMMTGSTHPMAMVQDRKAQKAVAEQTQGFAALLDSLEGVTDHSHPEKAAVISNASNITEDELARLAQGVRVQNDAGQQSIVRAGWTEDGPWFDVQPHNQGDQGQAAPEQAEPAQAAPAQPTAAVQMKQRTEQVPEGEQRDAAFGDGVSFKRRLRPFSGGEQIPTQTGAPESPRSDDQASSQVRTTPLDPGLITPEGARELALNAGLPEEAANRLAESVKPAPPQDTKPQQSVQDIALASGMPSEAARSLNAQPAPAAPPPAAPHSEGRLQELVRTKSPSPVHPYHYEVTQTAPQTEHAQKAQRLADAIGAKVVWFNQHPQAPLDVNGLSDRANGTLYLNARAAAPHDGIAVHEAMHDLEQRDPEAYARVTQVINQNTSDMSGYAQAYRDNAQQHKVKVGNDDTIHEFYGDVARGLGQSETFWERLADLDAPALTKLAHSLRRFARRIAGTTKPSNATGLGREAMASVKNVHRIERAMVQAIKNSKRRAPATRTQPDARFAMGDRPRVQVRMKTTREVMNPKPRNWRAPELKAPVKFLGDSRTQARTNAQAYEASADEHFSAMQERSSSLDRTYTPEEQAARDVERRKGNQTGFYLPPDKPGIPTLKEMSQAVPTPEPGSKKQRATPSVALGEAATGESPAASASILSNNFRSVKAENGILLSEVRAIPLAEAVAAGKLAADEAAAIDAFLDAFPERIRERFQVQYSNEDKIFRDADSGRVVTAVEFQQRIGQEFQDARHVCVLMRNGTVADVVEQFGRFLHDRLTTAAEAPLLKSAMKADQTLTAEEKNNRALWYGRRFQSWALQDNAAPKGLLSQFHDALRALKAVFNRLDPRGLNAGIKGYFSQVMDIPGDYGASIRKQMQTDLDALSDEIDAIKKNKERTGKDLVRLRKLQDRQQALVSSIVEKNFSEVMKDATQTMRQVAPLQRRIAKAESDRARILNGREKKSLSKQEKTEVNSLEQDIKALKEKRESMRDVKDRMFYTPGEILRRLVFGDFPDSKQISNQGFSKNAKTYYSFDPGTQCPKQVEFVNWMYNDLLSQKHSPDAAAYLMTDVTVIAAEMKRATDAGVDVPCMYCYVESARQAALKLWSEGERISRVDFAQAKIVVASVPYKDYILKLSDEKIKEINARGGLRLFSFSDYVREMHYDQIALLLEHAKQRGLSVKAITKNTQFVEDFAHTGILINLSLDNCGSGVPLNEALKLKDRFPDNVKLRATALRMRSDWVDPETGKLTEVGSVEYYVNLKDENGDYIIDVITPNHEPDKKKLAPGFQDLTWNTTNGKEMREFLKNWSQANGDDALTRICCQTGGHCLHKDEEKNHHVQCATNCGARPGPLFIPHTDNGPINKHRSRVKSKNTSQDIADAIERAKAKRGTQDNTSDFERMTDAHAAMNADARFSLGDREYMAAVDKGDMDTAQRMVNEAAKKAGVPTIADGKSYTVHRGPEPKKVLKAYKKFTVVDGAPQTLFVGGEEAIPTGVWLDAVEPYSIVDPSNGKEYIPTMESRKMRGSEIVREKMGTRSVPIPNEEVRQELIRRGFLSEKSKATKILCVAKRPGWHAAEFPRFGQGGRVLEGRTKINNANDVYYEVLLDNTHDYNTEAEQYSRKDMVKMPVGGTYEKYTNVDDSEKKGNWYIGGRMKVVRALTEQEVEQILRENDVEPQRWDAGKAQVEVGALDLDALRISPLETPNKSKLLDPVTYDDQGEVIPLSERFNQDSPDPRFALGDKPKSSSKFEQVASQSSIPRVAAEMTAAGKDSPGRPELANPGRIPDARRAVRNTQTVMGTPEPRSFEDMQRAASRLDRDEVEAKVKAGKILSPEETFAALDAIHAATNEALRTGDWQHTTELAYGWVKGGTDLGRTMAARVDRAQSAADRFEQAIALGMAAPSGAIKKKLDEAHAKREELKALLEEIEKNRKALELQRDQLLATVPNKEIRDNKAERDKLEKQAEVLRDLRRKNASQLKKLAAQQANIEAQRELLREQGKLNDQQGRILERQAKDVEAAKARAVQAEQEAEKAERQIQKQRQALTDQATKLSQAAQLNGQLKRQVATLNRQLARVQAAQVAQQKQLALVTRQYNTAMARHNRDVQRLQAKLARKGIIISQLLAELRRLKATKTPILTPSVRKSIAAIRMIHAAKDATISDKLYEFWIASLLSGPLTNVSNIASNTVNGAFEFGVRRNIEAVVNTILRKQGATRLGELPQIWAGLVPGFKMALLNSMAAFDTELAAFQETVQDAQMARLGGATAQTKMAAAKAAGVQYSGYGYSSQHVNAAIGGTRGRIIRIPLRGLVAMDEFTKSLVARMDVGAQAYRLGKAQGLSGSALSTFIANEVADYGSESWGHALETGVRMTFQTKMSDKAEAISHDIGNSAAAYIVPFRRTPVNIFKQAVKLTPAGILATAYKWRGLENDDKIRRVADGLFSAALTAALWSMVGNDDDDDSVWITGSLPFKATAKGQREHAARGGLAAQSIRIGDTWYPYGRIEPFASAISAIVDTLHAIKNEQHGKDRSENIAQYVEKMGALVVDKTFLRGLGDVVSAVQDARQIKQWLENYAYSWVPNAVRQTNRARDPYVRDANGPAFEKEHMLNRAFGLPTVPPKIDLWGEPVRKGSESEVQTDFLFRLLNPVEPPVDVKSRPALARHLDRALLNWNNQHDLTDQYWPEMPERSVQYQGIKYDLDSKQYEQLCRRGGGMALEMLASAGIDAKNPTPENIAYIKEALEQAHNAAAMEMFQELYDKNPKEPKQW